MTTPETHDSPSAPTVSVPGDLLVRLCDYAMEAVVLDGRECDDGPEYRDMEAVVAVIDAQAPGWHDAHLDAQVDAIIARVKGASDGE